MRGVKFKKKIKEKKKGEKEEEKKKKKGEERCISCSRPAGARRYRAGSRILTPSRSNFREEIRGCVVVRKVISKRRQGKFLRENYGVR